MGKPSLILAALAADALPGIRFVQVQNLTIDGDGLTTELLTTDDGRGILLKSPKTAVAATDLGTEVRALRVLKNVALPFSVSALLGQTSPKAIRQALAFEYVPGSPIDLSRVRLEDPLINSIGQALARIHSIPSSLVSDAGLPEYQPAQRVRERVAEFDRAMDTGKIHRDLLERWQTALLDVNLFRYQPVVVHGGLRSDVLLAEGTDIVGVTEWRSLCVDDPASDLAFIYGEAQPEIAAAITLAYEGSIRADRNLKQRANLYFELSLATYLLQVMALGDEEGIEEATLMLTQLHQDLVEGLLPSLTPSEFATSAPEVITPISQAASFTAPVTIITESIEVVDLAEVQPLAAEEKPEKPEDELF